MVDNQYFPAVFEIVRVQNYLLVILKDRYPFPPNIEDQLDELQPAKVYSTWDLEMVFFKYR